MNVPPYSTNGRFSGASLGQNAVSYPDSYRLLSEGTLSGEDRALQDVDSRYLSIVPTAHSPVSILLQGFCRAFPDPVFELGARVDSDGESMLTIHMMDHLSLKWTETYRRRVYVDLHDAVLPLERRFVDPLTGRTMAIATWVGLQRPIERVQIDRAVWRPEF